MQPDVLRVADVGDATEVIDGSGVGGASCRHDRKHLSVGGCQRFRERVTSHPTLTVDGNGDDFDVHHICGRPHRRVYLFGRRDRDRALVIGSLTKH